MRDAGNLISSSAFLKRFRNDCGSPIVHVNAGAPTDNLEFPFLNSYSDERNKAETDNLCIALESNERFFRTNKRRKFSKLEAGNF